METKKKITIAGTIISLAVAGTLGGVGGIVRLEVGNDTVYLTGNNYKEVKLNLEGKYLSSDSFTWQELQFFAAIINKEIKNKNLRTIEGITNQQDIVEKMIEEINQRSGNK